MRCGQRWFPGSSLFQAGPTTLGQAWVRAAAPPSPGKMGEETLGTLPALSGPEFNLTSIQAAAWVRPWPEEGACLCTGRGEGTLPLESIPYAEWGDQVSSGG